jgi:hypothetical protein
MLLTTGDDDHLAERAPRIVVERPPSPNGRDSWLAGYLPSAILSSIGSIQLSIAEHRPSG